MGDGVGSGLEGWEGFVDRQLYIISTVARSMSGYSLSLICQPDIRGHEAPHHHQENVIVQQLCESRGGRPGLSVLTSLLVSVDVKLY